MYHISILQKGVYMTLIVGIALTIVGSIIFDVYMERNRPVPQPLPPQVQQVKENKMNNGPQTVPYNKSQAQTQSQTVEPIIPDPFETGYHDGYNGVVAPGRWTLLHRYRIGWYAGKRDFQENRPNRYNG